MIFRVGELVMLIRQVYPVGPLYEKAATPLTPGMVGEVFESTCEDVVHRHFSGPGHKTHVRFRDRNDCIPTACLKKVEDPDGGETVPTEEELTV